MTIVLCYICVNIDVTGRLPLQDRAIIRALESKHQSQSNDTAFYGGVFLRAWCRLHRCQKHDE